MIMYLCARDINVPLSTPFLFLMYLCAFYTFSIDQAKRENGHVFVC